MSKKIYILLLLAAVFTACSTANGIPIDDAYYSPEIENGTPVTPSIPTTHTTVTTPESSAPSTSIEYINVQDTTVTIRIKK